MRSHRLYPPMRKIPLKRQTEMELISTSLRSCSVLWIYVCLWNVQHHVRIFNLTSPQMSIEHVHSAYSDANWNQYCHFYTHASSTYSHICRVSERPSRTPNIWLCSVFWCASKCQINITTYLYICIRIKLLWWHVKCMNNFQLNVVRVCGAWVWCERRGHSQKLNSVICTWHLIRHIATEIFEYE